MEEIAERLKINLRDLRINKSDIDICHRYNDYEDMGFYTYVSSNLKDETIENITKLLKELEQDQIIEITQKIMEVLDENKQ